MISSLVFARYLKADILQVKLIAKADKPNPRLALTTSFSKFSMLSFAVGVSLASVTLLGGSLSSVVAQMPLGETTMSQVQVLFVNPSVGDDTGGNGSDRTPVKTITQALRLATPNTVIRLSPGIYSAETGEVFPLMLKAGVSIQGDAANKGRGITIQGGGEYLSRSFGGQNVAIVGANQSGLTGVTVTNPNPRGYGLWIESSNPVITENTFTGNTQDGISIAGNSATTIDKNYFYRNGANGITIGGTSQPQVRDNIFEETGFGINITQNAAPLLINNQIQNNRSGILAQANSRPILRNNLIQNNKEDGLVAIAQAMPDLGSGNEFRNNARYDINASAAKQMILAGGNTLDSNRIAGKVDINAQTAPVANNQPAPAPNSVISQIPANGEITFSASTASNTTNKPTVNTQLLPLQPAGVPLTAPSYNQQPLTSQVSGFPIPSSLIARETQVAPTATIQPDTPQLNYVHIDPKTIEFVAPQQPSNLAGLGVQPQSQLSPIPETAPQINSAILPVPNGNIPQLPVPQTYTTTYSGSYGQPSRTKQMGVLYRVVVETLTDREQEIVRFLAPGAFSTVWQGRRVMQAGVFSNRYNAEEMLKILNGNGLRTIIEPLN